MDHPSVVVWDLDGTLWSPEMYQLRTGAPFAPATHDHAVVSSGGEVVQLLGDAAELVRRQREAGATLAIASTCDEPDWARECLALLRVDDEPLEAHFHPDAREIYYAPTKRVHFQAIAKKLRVPFADMVRVAHGWGWGPLTGRCSRCFWTTKPTTYARCSSSTCTPCSLPTASRTNCGTRHCSNGAAHGSANKTSLAIHAALHS